ncbi:MAG: acyl-CoA dehydrogenase family protein [Bdellovibrionia bacterium]
MSLLEFTPEHEAFRDSVRKFIDKEIRPFAEQWEEAGKTPRSVWKRCGELGFLGISYPEDVGGLGAEFIYNYIFSEEMSRCGSPGVATGLAVQTDMATPALAEYGNKFLKEKYLKPAIAGDMICSIAITEPNCGSDVAGIQTRAVRDGDDYVINGRKTFITNGTQADFITLLARTSDKPGHHCFSLFVVPTKTRGYSVGKVLKKICHPSSDTAEIVLQDVRLSKDHLIGEEGEGFIYQMRQFQFERLAGVANAIGMMKRGYELTKQYCKERETFGKPLIQRQVVQHKLAEMYAEITTIESLAHKCVALAQAKKDFSRECTVLKLKGARAKVAVLEECVQLHGGYGLMHEYEVSRLYRDAKLTTIGGGSNEMMLEIIGKMEGLR